MKMEKESFDLLDGETVHGKLVRKEIGSID
jgi:hypothetical protein